MQSGKKKNAINSDLKARQRRAFQKLLEQIETKYPERAAQLDNRDFDEIF